MEMNAIEDTKNKLVFEMEGAGHTVCNLLKNELKDDKNVKTAAYNIDHPLTGKPKILVETKGTVNPRTSVKKALKKIDKDFDSLKKKISKEFK